ncbi:hypothetical protein [Bdellovibrio bacteriovorus]|uniref:hypothetical protein n=1 Tax=Bdellovibrio bacteriovorus TaxID=959 RepID=UPI0035A57CC1
MNFDFLVNRIFLVIIVIAALIAVIVLLSKIERSFFGTDRIAQVFQKKENLSNSKGRIKPVYFALLAIVLLPIFYEIACDESCKIAVKNFFTK